MASDHYQQQQQQQQFSLADYSVFILMLLISTLIGLYYAWKDRNETNVEQLLLGGRRLHLFPVSMSLLASFTSAISILGFSQEMYLYGSMYCLIGVSYFITQPFATEVYLPFFHRLKLNSAYEYLERRFNYPVRFSASLIFCIQILFYMSVALYAPALAIQQVTGISLWVSIFLTGLVCTIYTSLGGLKAVVWTDTFQVFVMFAGLIGIIVEGTRRVGGIQVVWQRAYETDRIEFIDFDPSPLKRHTFWSIMIGGFFTSLTVYGSNQANIQRYLSVTSVRDSKRAMYINTLGTFLILCVCCMCGFVAFAFYYGCDPKLNGEKIKKYDQILPYFVMDILNEYKGLPGLFIACIYSAAISSLSSGLNSLTAVFLHDFIYPFHPNLSHSNSIRISKLIAALLGVLTIGLSFSCTYFSSTVLQISLSIFGLLGGPLLGVISLGMFVRCVESKGALAGLIAGAVCNTILGIGSALYAQRPPMKPLSTDLCYNNQTYSTNSTSAPPSSPTAIEWYKYAFNVSYYWFSLIGLTIVFVVAISVSCFLANKKTNSPKPPVDEMLLCIDLFGLGSKKKQQPSSQQHKEVEEEEKEEIINSYF